jgi:hypothetical protein
MKKKNYVRIDFENCGVDYGYTIQPWSELHSYLDAVKDDFTEVDEVGYSDWKAKGYLPEVKISLVQMTDSEYEKWFNENILATA